MFHFKGKFGQRTDIGESRIFISGQEGDLFRLMQNRDKQLVNFDIICDNKALLVEYHSRSGQDHFDRNVVLASFTACWGRLKLYESLSKVAKTVLYCDTGY